MEEEIMLLLKKVDLKWKWLVKEDDGRWFLFTNKPAHKQEGWDAEDSEWTEFPFAEMLASVEFNQPINIKKDI